MQSTLLESTLKLTNLNQLNTSVYNYVCYSISNADVMYSRIKNNKSNQIIDKKGGDDDYDNYCYY